MGSRTIIQILDKHIHKLLPNLSAVKRHYCLWNGFLLKAWPIGLYVQLYTHSFSVTIMGALTLLLALCCIDIGLILKLSFSLLTVADITKASLFRPLNITTNK